MKVLGRYDTELQMFTESPRDPGRAHLGFLRWLAEQGRLEHEAIGAPVGEYVTDQDDLDARPRGLTRIDSVRCEPTR